MIKKVLFHVKRSVAFCTTCSDLEAYLAAGCLVHPTFEDTFAMAVSKVMSYGLPRVISRCEFCAIAWLLETLANSLLLNNLRDAQFLMLLLEESTRDFHLQRTLFVQSLRFAKRFQWSAIAEQQDTFYRAVRFRS